MKNSFLKIWLIPIVLGIFSAVGLVSALTGDGFYNLVSWLLLGIPVITMIWFVPWRKRKVNL